jgi:acyl carrier protein
VQGIEGGRLTSARVLDYDEASVHGSLQEAFRRVFGLPDLALTDATPFLAIPGWASLSYVNVVYDIEQTMGFRFSDTELEQLYDLGTFGELRAAVGTTLATRRS